MKNQRELQTVTMTSSEMKENYVAPKTVSYRVQNEGVLCSSPITGGNATDPEWGGSTGFGSVSETNSMWN